jgi:hypothetical protein
MIHADDSSTFLTRPACGERGSVFVGTAYPKTVRSGRQRANITKICGFKASEIAKSQKNRRADACVRCGPPTFLIPDAGRERSRRRDDLHFEVRFSTGTDPKSPT